MMGGSNSSLRNVTAAGLLVAIGIVFGDIGTSPLYVMKAATAINSSYNADYIIGIVSCVIWTLTLQTTVKYVLIALRADNNGEGGILALYALLRRLPRKWLYIVASIGAAALIADGVITPAITVTSAVEGLRVVMPEVNVLPIVIVIIAGIFLLQQAGTKRIGCVFGPFMLAWFTMLGILGAVNMPEYMPIVKAFNPWFAIRLLISSPEWFLIMGAVFLCTTGAEALYSDLGHCGRKNIAYSWIFVKAMLILNYLGQGAWLISAGPGAVSLNPFFAIMPHWFTIVGVIMSTGAAIIASQALLSGSFTIFSEAFSLGLWPKLKIKYPSNEKGQLYIPAVNFTLLAGCLITVLMFRDSSHMEAAYGLAITVTMLMTTALLALWLRLRGAGTAVSVAFFVVFVSIEGLFFSANLFKFVHGGWYSLLIAGLVAFVMIVWRKSSTIRTNFLYFKSFSECKDVINAIRKDETIAKYASNLIYFSRSSNKDKIEDKLVYSIVNKQPKRADHYWFIHIETDDSPETLEYEVDIIEEQAIYYVTMRLGFRVEPKVSVYLRQIVEDLVASGRLDLRSTYPSLRSRDIAGDFRFIILHRIFSPSSNCRRGEATMMRLHELLRRTGVSDQAAFGLDTSVVMLETVPLIINTEAGRRIVPARLSE